MINTDQLLKEQRQLLINQQHRSSEFRSNTDVIFKTRKSGVGYAHFTCSNKKSDISRIL